MNTYQNNSSKITGTFRLLAGLAMAGALWVIPARDSSAFLLADDFSSYPTLNPGWVAGGPGASGWGIGGGTLAVSSGDVVGTPANWTTLTRALSMPTMDWTVDLRYGWLAGSGSTAARDAFAMLDSSGNGYGIYIEQANRAGNMAIQRYAGGSPVASVASLTKPFADIGLNVGGGALTPIRLDWQASTGKLDLYLGTPGGAAGSVTFFASATDTTYSSASFTQLRLGNINYGGFQSTFDDVLVVPEPTSIALVVCGGLFVVIRRRRI